MYLPDFFTLAPYQNHHYGKPKYSGYGGDVGFIAAPCFEDDLLDCHLHV